MFGGFSGGSRVNYVRLVQFQAPSTLVWSTLHAGDPLSKKAPHLRNAHSGICIANTSIFIFGGQDDENNKLGDVWEFNVQTKAWTKREVNGQFEGLPRSGHAAVSFASKMYVFGGIFEVTKEMNDLVLFDTKTNKFTILDQNGDNAESANYNARIEEQAKASLEGNNSPLQRRATISPNRRGTMGAGNSSPARKSMMGHSGSPNTSALAKSPSRKPNVSISTGTGGQGSAVDDRLLSSPTSVSMQNSFIIKNADESFDLYYQQMKRRRHQNAFNT